jgi:hypothetical protein
MKEESSGMEMLGGGQPFPILPGFRGLPGTIPANGGLPTLPPSSQPPLPNMWPFIWNHISK